MVTLPLGQVCVKFTVEGEGIIRLSESLIIFTLDGVNMTDQSSLRLARFLNVLIHAL